MERYQKLCGEHVAAVSKPYSIKKIKSKIPRSLGYGTNSLYLVCSSKFQLRLHTSRSVDSTREPSLK